MAELMRMEILNAVVLAELLKKSSWILGVHRISRAVLGEYPLTDAPAGLLSLRLAQKIDHLRADINGMGFPDLRRINVDAHGVGVL